MFFFILLGLRKAFDSFDTEKIGSITIDTISTILRMMGLKVTERGLKEVVDEVDEDGKIFIKKFIFV